MFLYISKLLLCREDIELCMTVSTDQYNCNEKLFLLNDCLVYNGHRKVSEVCPVWYIYPYKQGTHHELNGVVFVEDTDYSIVFYIVINNNLYIDKGCLILNSMEFPCDTSKAVNRIQKKSKIDVMIKVYIIIDLSEI